MAKEFYTERDIEDMVKRGVTSLQLTENVVLTELAYEKAQRLGMQLVKDKPVEPPAAPVRPYLAQVRKPDPVPASVSFAATPPSVPVSAPVATSDLTTRIREAVNARLGAQVDPQLLDVIIQRVLKSTGVK